MKSRKLVAHGLVEQQCATHSLTLGRLVVTDRNSVCLWLLWCSFGGGCGSFVISTGFGGALHGVLGNPGGLLILGACGVS